MSVTIKYKGNTIASANTDTTKTLKTSGKYCEDDITIENVQDGGITPSGSVTLTEENTYDVTDKATAVVDMSATRANLAEAVTAKGVDTLPTSSFDTIATNIGLIEGGGGDSVVKYTTVVESLVAEDSIYNILLANPYKCFYHESMINLFIFSDVEAVTSSNYVNNRFYLYHVGASLKAKAYQQVERKERTANAILTNGDLIGNMYGGTAALTADGQISFRTAGDTIKLAVGSKVVVVEIPFNDNLTLFGEA